MAKRPQPNVAPNLRTPGGGRARIPERMELSQAFGEEVRTPQRALPSGATSTAPAASASSTPTVSGSAIRYPDISVSVPAGMTINGSSSDQQDGASPQFEIAFEATAALLKGDGTGGITDAVPGTDYLSPTTAVTGLNGETGSLTLQSSGGTVAITTPSMGVINLEAMGGGGGGGLAPVSAPTDITDCNLWLSADTLPVVADGTGIATWTDGSGNGNDFSQATGANQWLYYNTVLNGKPCARAAGSAFMTGPLAAVPLSDFTIFIVAKVANGNNASTGRLFGLDDASTGFNALGIYSTGLRTWIIRDGASPYDVTAVIPPSDGFSYIYTLEMSARQGSSYYLNGALVGSNAGTAFTLPPSLTAMHLGSPGIGGSAGSWFSGDLYEFLVYSRPLTLTERLRIHLYLSNKWGI